MPIQFDAIYLSPHLDDAVLSCGGQLAARAARGERQLVVTAFTASVAGEPGPVAADLHRWWGLGGDAALARRAEDRAALVALGAEALHLDLPEAIYRREPGGGPRYRSLAALFEAGRAAGEREIEDALVERIRRLPECGRLLAPLAVGGHVDHALTRRAAERACGDLLTWYEDLPYGRDPRAVAAALGDPAGWTSEVVPLPEPALQAKIAAALRYASQVRTLFKTPERLARELRAMARTTGGERLWRRPGA